MRIKVVIFALGTLVALPTMALDADAVYINGKIYTVNDAQPWVDAVAIQHGRFVAVGSDEDIHEFIGPSTHVVDLGSRMAMPGIHDAHIHLSYSGLKWTHECRLPVDPSLDEIVSALKQCRAERPSEPWLVAGEFNPNVLPNGKIDNKFLDEAFPNIPVYLYDYSIHHGLANSTALSLAGINEYKTDPSGGRIIRNSDTGEPTGELVETATALVTAAIPAYPDAVYRDAVLWAVRVANRYGITSVQEASATRETLVALKELDEAGDLSLNIAAHLVWGSPKFGALNNQGLERLIASREAYRTAHVDVDFIKVWMDGAPLPPHTTQASIDADGRVDESKLLVTEKVLTRKLLEWDRQGVTAKIHVAGDGAARVALNALQAMRKRNGQSDLRHGLAHAGFLSPQDMPRFKKLAVDAEMSPAIWHLTGALAMPSGFQFKTLYDHGARLVVGSDWIITPDPNLFPALGGMLDRGEESIDLGSALRILTLNGAAAVGGATEFGSIETGKSANMIVLNQNLFAIPKQKIKTTEVMRTIFEGKIVYSRGTFSETP